jgi:hypothetical protein
MAKKLSRDQKRKQKKRKRRSHRSQSDRMAPQYSRMIQRLKAAGLGDHKFIYAPKQTEKMSEVLLDFIRPYYEFADTTEAMHRLIATALVAWNTALLPREEQEQSLRQVSETLPADVVEDFYAIVGEMMERKNKYFAHHTRQILDYDLVDTGKEYRVSVVSLMPPTDIEDEA